MVNWLLEVLLETILKISQYLKGNLYREILYGKNDHELETVRHQKVFMVLE